MSLVMFVGKVSGSSSKAFQLLSVNFGRRRNWFESAFTAYSSMSLGLSSTQWCVRVGSLRLVKLVGQGNQSKTIQQSCVWEKYETRLKSVSSRLLWRPERHRCT